jgi:hypothetical protein
MEVSTMKLKHFNKKLVLKKNTIANLSEAEQQNVRGGTGSFTCPWDWLCNSYMPCGETEISECWTIAESFCGGCPI